MGFGILAQAGAMASSVGLGCGTSCGSGAGLFLSAYAITHAKNRRQSLYAFLSFYLGKIMAVMAVCMAASALGQSIIDSDGTIAGLDMNLVFSLGMGAMAVYLIIHWFLEKNGSRRGCKTCRQHSCSGPDLHSMEGKNYAALYVMGLGYGISPCAPLILMAGYAAAASVPVAAVTGFIFASASALSPGIILLILTGALTGKMQTEMPEYLDYFRLMCYVLLLAICVIMLI